MSSARVFSKVGFPAVFFCFLLAACASAPEVDGAISGKDAPDAAKPMELSEAAPDMKIVLDPEKTMDTMAAPRPDTEKKEDVSDKQSDDPDAKVVPPGKIETRAVTAKLPALLSRISGEEQSPLPLLGQDVTVAMTASRARVVLDLIYANPTEQRLSGQLMIPLPQGASPAALILYSSDQVWSSIQDPIGFQADWKLPESLWAASPLPGSDWTLGKNPLAWSAPQSAKVVEPVQARQVYEQVVRRRVDPALAEWAGGNTFSTRIFPLEPKSLKRIVFIYDRPLALSDGLARMELPPGGGEGRSRVNLWIEGPGLTDPVLRMGKAALSLEPSGSGFRVSVLHDKGPVVSQTFEARDLKQKALVMVGESQGISERFAHVLYRPEIAVSETSFHDSRAIFLLDTSYSGKQKLFSLSGRLLRALLESDADLKEFQIWTFDVAARPLTSGWMANTPENRQRSLEEIEGLWLEGATNFQGVLESLSQEKEALSEAPVFLLSDGQINWGLESPQALERGFPQLWKKRWICYSWGEDPVNRPLFESLTKASGRVVAVAGEGDIDAAALAHKTGGVPLEGLSVAPEGIEMLLAGQASQLYPGQSLEFALKIPAGVTEAVLTLKAGGRTESVRLELLSAPRTSALAARSWAEIYVQRLLSLNDPQADRAALALSQRFSLANRIASFLILENESEFATSGIGDETLNWGSLLRQARSRGQGQKPGALERGDFSPEIQKLLTALEQGPPKAPWKLPDARAASAGRAIRNPGRPSDRPGDIYSEAQALSAQDQAAALRVLSTIVEINPGDDQGARLVGFTLMSWGLFREAEDVFAKLRRKRPFEPQNYFWESLAQAASGQLAQAAAGFERILAGDFPRFGEYTKRTAVVIYRELLEAAVSRLSAETVSAPISLRLQSLISIDAPRQTDSRIVVFWNLDDTDIDLHVQENFGEHISYEHKTSGSGGELFWDNTEGLGPELLEHPRGQLMDVSLHYYGSSSAEGKAPAAGFTILWDRRSKPAKVEFLTTLLPAGVQDLHLVKRGFGAR